MKLTNWEKRDIRLIMNAYFDLFGRQKPKPTAQEVKTWLRNYNKRKD